MTLPAGSPIPGPVPAAAAPAAPAPLPPLRYHRLLRALPRYRWWKPLLAIVLTGVYWLVLQSIWTGAFAVFALFSGRLGDSLDFDAIENALLRFLSIDAADGLSIVAVVGGVATMLPSAILAYLSVGLRPWSVLRSVAFRFRWGWMALCLLPALLITVVATAVDAWVLPLVGDGGMPGAPTTPIGTFIVCAVLFIVLTPIQAAAEEFGFRGVVTQAVGSWVKPAWVSVAVSTIVFALLHTQYFGWATLDVAIFGVVAAVLVWRTGGLEASIALHAVNNTVSFVFLATGAEGSTQGFDPEHQTTGDPLSVLVTLVTMAAYLGLVELMVRRRRIRTVLEPVAVAPAVVPAPALPAPHPATLRAE
jgi:uncharacterized protein